MKYIEIQNIQSVSLSHSQIIPGFETHLVTIYIHSLYSEIFSE